MAKVIVRYILLISAAIATRVLAGSFGQIDGTAAAIEWAGGLLVGMWWVRSDG